MRFFVAASPLFTRPAHPRHPSTKTIRPPRRILATSATALLALAFLPTGAHATPGTWDDGGTPSANWSTDTNWVGDVIPVNGDNLDFSAHAGVANLTVNHDIVASSFGSITFTNKQFTIGGSGLALSGGIFNNSAVTQTITFSAGNALALNASQQFNAQGGALVVTSSVNFSPNVVLTVTGALNTTLSGLLVGNATNSITKNGAGILTLSAANVYGGTTTLAFGTLSAQNATALGTSTLALNGGTLDFGGANAVSLANPVTIGGDFTFSTTAAAGNGHLTGNIALGAVTHTVTVADAHTITWDGIVSGTAGITFAGTSLSYAGAAANTYSGLTTVGSGFHLKLFKNAGVNALAGDVLVQNGGRLTMGASEQIADTATVTLEAGATARILNNGTETIGTLNGAGTFDINGGGPVGTATVRVGAGIFSGVLSSTSNTSDFVKLTSGTLTLSGANTYTGATKVERGTLLLGVNNTLPVGTDVTIHDATGAGSAVLDLNGFNQTVKSLTFIAPSIGSNVALHGGVLTLGGDIFLVNNTTNPGTAGVSVIQANGNAASALDLGGATRTFFIAGQSHNGIDLAVEGVIQGTGGVVINATPSTSNGSEGGVFFQAANTYTGATTVARGRLTTQAVGALPTTTDLILGTAASAFTGDLELRGVSQTVNSIALAAGNTGGVNNYITTSAAFGPATFTVSSTTTDSTFAGLITGPVTLVKDGDRNVLDTTLTLTAANTYTGDTKVNDGTTKVGIDNALPVARNVIVNRPNGDGNATFDVNGFNQTVNDLHLIAPTTNNGADTKVTIGVGKLTVTGAISLDDNTTDNGNGEPGEISSTTGFLELNGGLRNINVAGNNLNHDLTISAIVQNGGINFTGMESASVGGQFGTLQLTRVNTYAGGTVINDGIVAITNDNNLGAVAGQVTFNDFAGGIPSALRFDSAVLLVAGRTLFLGSNGTLDPNGLTSTVASLVTGGGILIIDHINNQSTPGGRVILTNLANSHSGGTAIFDGTTLQVSSAAPLGSGPIYFDGGGILNAAGNLVTNKSVILAPQTALGGSGTGKSVFDASAGTVSKLDGVISGIGQLTKIGAGELTLTARIAMKAALTLILAPSRSAAIMRWAKAMWS